MANIGQKGQKGSDWFTLRATTPRGLARAELVDGILAHGRMVVLRRYDDSVLEDWVSHTVKRCDAGTWSASVDNLGRYFHWEFENYSAGRRTTPAARPPHRAAAIGGLAVQPLLRNIGVENEPRGQRWTPDDPDRVFARVTLDVQVLGDSAKHGFTLVAATPGGLANMEAVDGVLASGKLLVMERYDFTAMRLWLEEVVRQCAADSWREAVDRLGPHFDLNRS